MRPRIVPFALVSSALLLATPLLAHAGVAIPFFGPIVDTASWTDCPLGWPAVIQVLNRIIAFSITIAVTFVAPIMLAYAGYLFVINPVNPSGIAKARDVLWKTILGIVLALAGYLIIDAGLTALTAKNLSGWTSQLFSQGGNICLTTIPSAFNQVGNQGGGGGSGVQTVSPGGAPGSPPQTISGTCSQSQLITAGIDPSVAAQFSCLAQAESSCGTDPNICSNSASSACGEFQILLTGTGAGHNLNFPVCTQAAQAAGYNVSGNLNCTTAFQGHNGAPPTVLNADLAGACRAAAQNLNCNATAAQWLYNNDGGFKDWAQSDAKCGITP